MQFIVLALVIIYFIGWDNFLILLVLLIVALVIYLIYLIFLKDQGTSVTNITTMVAQNKPRREVIPKSVQREVWQRDGGKCVECGTKEKLCYDHIIPFSKGGSNVVRNLQLLCERCNLTKGNRI